MRARRVGTPRANAHGSRWSDDVEAAEGSVHDLEAAVDASFPQPLAVGDVLGANTSRLPTPLQPVAIPPGLQFAQGLRASSQRRCRIPCPGTSASRIGAGAAPHPSVPPVTVVPGRSAIGEHQVATALEDRGHLAALTASNAREAARPPPALVPPMAMRVGSPSARHTFGRGLSAKKQSRRPTR